MSKTATMVRRAAATATLVFVPFAMMSAYPAGSMPPRAFTANKLAAAIAASNSEAARPIFAKSEGMKLDSIAPSVAQAGYRSPGVRHKARVGDRDVSKTLTTAGARMLGDYGGFVLFEVDDAIADSIAQQSSIELADEYNRVLLNAGALDTSTPAVQALRSVHAAASGGKQMHLIQFVGPIRPEWYQALVATGVRIVSYMIAVAMRQHDEIEPGEIDAFRFDVAGEGLGVVARVEENPLAVDFDQGGVAPIAPQPRIVLAERVVEHRDAGMGCPHRRALSSDACRAIRTGTPRPCAPSSGIRTPRGRRAATA